MCKGEMSQLDSSLIVPIILLLNHFLGNMVTSKLQNIAIQSTPWRLYGKTLLYTISLFLNSKMMLFWQRVPFLQIYLEPRFQVSQKILLLATLVWTTADLLWYFTVRHSSSFFPLSIHFYFSLYLKWSKSTLSNNPKGIALVFAKRFASTLRWDSFFWIFTFSVAFFCFRLTLSPYPTQKPRKMNRKLWVMIIWLRAKIMPTLPLSSYQWDPPRNKMY